MRRIRQGILAIWAGLLLVGCGAPPMETVQASSETIEYEYDSANDIQLTQEATIPTPAAKADALAPLSIVRSVQSFGDGYIVYPKVLYCQYSEKINESIYATTAAWAEKVSTAIFTKYRIEYNRNGLFSLRMELYDLYGDGSEILETLYLNYNVHTGELCTIGDLFDQEDTRWRGIMPDMVMAQAEARGMTLLCNVMPITDEQQFYITSGSIVLHYSLYEIATWTAGEPEFPISVAQLAEFIPADSPLANMIRADEPVQSPEPALEYSVSDTAEVEEETA